MSVILNVTDPGAASAVQDLGRFGHRASGVPVAGALDNVSLRLLNGLLGNDPAEAALEIRLSAPTFVAGDSPARLALGGTLNATLHTPAGESRIEPWSTVTIPPQGKLDIKLLPGFMGGLIGFGGGLDLPGVLGSRATYQRAAIGGFQGRNLHAGDQLKLRRAASGNEHFLAQPFPLTASKIRVMQGPQTDHFSAQMLAQFIEQTYIVTPAMDRMGIRLEGSALAHLPEKGPDIISEGMVPGCIQVPGNGQPIIILGDGQTVGGYAKPAVVIAADLHKLAALKPGDKLQFQWVNDTQAQAAYRALETEIKKSLDSIVESHFKNGLDMQALYTANLIGGMVDGARPDHFSSHL